MENYDYIYGLTRKIAKQIDGEKIINSIFAIIFVLVAIKETVASDKKDQFKVDLINLIDIYL